MMAEINVVTGCADADCLMCSGEACNLCGAGCWSKRRDCEHDVIERHEEPEQTMTDNTQLSEERLEPCPFCGSAPRLHLNQYNAWEIACENCPMWPHRTEQDKSAVIKIWNSRASIAAPPRKLYSELIHIAAELVRADGFLSEDLAPNLRRDDVLKTARAQDERLKDWAMRIRRVADQLSSAVAAPQGDAKFVPPAEDALHVAICQAVQEHHAPTANAILRTALNDYNPTQLTRTELIRVQQRSGSGEVTAVMASPSLKVEEDAATERSPLRLYDRADGVKGHFCVGRKVTGCGFDYNEFWNKDKFTSAGEVFTGREAAEAKLRELFTTTAPPAPSPQIEGYERALTVDWEATNARRHELITKKAIGLSDDEANELRDLQWLAGIKRELHEGPPVAPIPEQRCFCGALENDPVHEYTYDPKLSHGFVPRPGASAAAVAPSPQIEGYERALTVDWEATNARRHELITKKSIGLSSAEANELRELQWLTGLKREILSGPTAMPVSPSDAARKAAFMEAIAVIVGLPTEHYIYSGPYSMEASTFRDNTIKALEAALVVGRSKATQAVPVGEGENTMRLRWLLTQIISDLPAKRDWLDPDLEREARELTGIKSRSSADAV